MSRPERVQVDLTMDEQKMLEIIRDAGPDADVEVFRRDGTIVNVVKKTIHRREFGPAKLREV